jgi:hypothetical protein
MPVTGPRGDRREGTLANSLGVRPFTAANRFTWYSIGMENSVNEENSWINDYVASYRYRDTYTWAVLILPIFGLLAIYLERRLVPGVAVAVGADLLFVLVFLQYRTYCVELSAGSVRTVSLLSNKSFALSDVDLIQHLYGGRGGQLLRIRHGDRILLTVPSDIDGFEDLVGFFREYASRHHLIFATRDDWGEWTQAGKSKAAETSPADE